ncbi:MAG: hypothetical protein R2875_15300 [Desulfobacterales bacterium]
MAKERFPFVDIFWGCRGPVAWIFCEDLAREPQDIQAAIKEFRCGRLSFILRICPRLPRFWPCRDRHKRVRIRSMVLQKSESCSGPIGRWRILRPVMNRIFPDQGPAL